MDMKSPRATTNVVIAASRVSLSFWKIDIVGAFFSYFVTMAEPNSCQTAHAFARKIIIIPRYFLSRWDRNYYVYLREHLAVQSP